MTTSLTGTVAAAGRHVADARDDVHARDDFAEDRVTVVEVRRRPERDEELAAVGAGPGVGHREDAGLAVAARRVELVGELEPRATHAVAHGAAALDDEAVDHAMEDEAVVERPPDGLPRHWILPLDAAVGQAREVGHRLGRLLLEQPGE